MLPNVILAPSDKVCAMLFKSKYNNTLDLYTWLTQLKKTLKIAENVCIKNNIEETFFKFHFGHEKL